MASMREDGGYNTLTCQKDKGAELRTSSQATTLRAMAPAAAQYSFRAMSVLC